jgi:hypothetical protein
MRFFFSLTLAIFLWQSSSCHSSSSNASKSPVRAANMNANAGNTINNAPQSPTNVKGIWGGLHIVMEVIEKGAEINYDCAHGRITEGIVPDRNGEFSVKGFHVRERAGPTRQGEENEQAATYHGSITGDAMTLTVTLAEKNETLGTFTLTRGSSGRVRKCR